MESVSAQEARRLLVSEPYDDSAEQRALISRKLALHLDGYFVPLAVADDSVFMRVNDAVSATRLGRQQHVRVLPVFADKVPLTRRVA